MIDDISDISERLRADAASNDHGTRDPMFCLQIKVRDRGLDPNYSDGKTVWVNMLSGDYEEVPEPEDEGQEGIQEFGYVDRWETVMISLTRKGLEDYMAVNGHNVRMRAHDGETRIWVDTFYRCEEMVRIRNYLMNKEAKNV